MKQIPFTQVRMKLKAIVDAATKGETIVITRKGKPVAEVRPTAEAEAAYWAKAKPLRLGKAGLLKELLSDRHREPA